MLEQSRRCPPTGPITTATAVSADGGPEGYRAHIVNFMQGLKTPPLKWLLDGDEDDRTAFRAALADEGWAMKMHGRPDRTVNGTEPLSGRSASQGTELCATAEHILSAQVALGKVGQIELSPLALTQLRITLFPWTTGTQKDDKL